MNLYAKIDMETGRFIEDVILDAPPALEDGTPDPTFVATPCPSGFYWPRWDGEKWVECRTAEEIAAIQSAAQEHELTDIEKLKIRTAANEDALAGMMDMMMGGML